MPREGRIALPVIGLCAIGLAAGCRKAQTINHFQIALELAGHVEEGNTGLPRYQDPKYQDVLAELELVKPEDRDYWVAQGMKQKVKEGRDKALAALNATINAEAPRKTQLPFDPSSVPTRVDDKPKRPADQLEEHPQQGDVDLNLMRFGVQESPIAITVSGELWNRTEEKIALRITLYALDQAGAVLGSSEGGTGPPVWPNDRATFKISFLAQSADDGGVSQGEVREGAGAVESARDRPAITDFDPKLVQTYRLEIRNPDGLELSWTDNRQGFERWEKPKKK